MKKGFRLSYNAPVVLTFCLICTAIMMLDQTLGNKLCPMLFMVPGAKSAVPFDWTNALSYIRLFTHVFGHGGWQHLLGNLSFILLVGPLMEEKYGSPMMASMMIITAFVTGMINACFLPVSLYGASGISFMLILLASISTVSKNEFPLSFVFFLTVFVAKEVMSPAESNVSTIAHIAGGLCGCLFGLFVAPKAGKVETINVSKPKKAKTKPLTAAEKISRLKAIDEASPRNRDDDKTVEIGTIKL